MPPNMLGLVRDAVNLIYPPCCLACGQAGLVESPSFCADCSEQLSKLSRTSMCPHCARPLPSEAACGWCEADGIYPLDKIVALAPFREPLRKMIHGIKYASRWPAAEILADRMLAEPRIASMLDETDALVAVPLHWTRQISRGYNQASAIARVLSRRRGIPLVRAIVRLKNTVSQTALPNRRHRQDNLRNAFGLIRPQAVAGKRVALVDDVTTTNATLKAAARAMGEAKPVCVSAIVLAVADARGRDFQAV